MFDHELAYYKNKPLHDLLDDSRVKLSRYTYSTEPPGVLNSVYLDFENNHTMMVHFAYLKYVKDFSIKCDWDFSLIQKEIISKCEFVK